MFKRVNFNLLAIVDKYGSHLIAKIINNGSGSNGFVAGVNLKYLIILYL